MGVHTKWIKTKSQVWGVIYHYKGELKMETGLTERQAFKFRKDLSSKGLDYTKFITFYSTDWEKDKTQF